MYIVLSSVWKAQYKFPRFSQAFYTAILNVSISAVSNLQPYQGFSHHIVNSADSHSSTHQMLALLFPLF
jgi:hypothetical protein